MARDGGTGRGGVAKGRTSNMVKTASRALEGFEDWDKSSAGSQDNDMMRRRNSTDIVSMIRFEALKWTGGHEETTSDEGQPEAVQGGRGSRALGTVRRVEDAPMAVRDLSTSDDVGSGSRQPAARSEAPSKGGDLLETKRAREVSHQQVVEQVAQERASRMLDRAT